MDTHTHTVTQKHFKAHTLLCVYANAHAQSTHSYEVREAQLRALSATPAKVSYKLATGPLLSVMESWLIEGDADQQHNFVRCVTIWCCGGDSGENVICTTAVRSA